MPEEYFSAREAEEAIKLARLVLEWVEELWRELSGKESS
jgi:HEPN domain-containing protein